MVTRERTAATTARSPQVPLFDFGAWIREISVWILIAVPIFSAYCFYIRKDDLNYLDYCSCGTCDPRTSALNIIKDEYMLENPHLHQLDAMNDIEVTVSVEANKNGHRKGVGVVLYCMTRPEFCENVISNVEQSLKRSNCTAPSRCTVTMKAREEDHADLKGEIHNELVSVFQNCRCGVIGFENLHQIRLSEAMTLITAMSEQGSLMHDGKSLDSTQGLFLFSMMGNPNDKDLNLKNLLDKARDQIYQAIVGKQEKNESVVGVGKAFRRRIDHVYPIFEMPT